MSYSPKSDFLKIMIERGFVADCTDYEGLDSVIAKGNLTAYVGFEKGRALHHAGQLVQHAAEPCHLRKGA